MELSGNLLSRVKSQDSRPFLRSAGGREYLAESNNDLLCCHHVMSSDSYLRPFKAVQQRIAKISVELYVHSLGVASSYKTS